MEKKHFCVVATREWNCIDFGFILVNEMIWTKIGNYLEFMKYRFDCEHWS